MTNSQSSESWSPRTGHSHTIQILCDFQSFFEFSIITMIRVYELYKSATTRMRILLLFMMQDDYDRHGVGWLLAIYERINQPIYIVCARSHPPIYSVQVWSISRRWYMNILLLFRFCAHDPHPPENNQIKEERAEDEMARVSVAYIYVHLQLRIGLGRRHRPGSSISRATLLGAIGIESSTGGSDSAQAQKKSRKNRGEFKVWIIECLDFMGITLNRFLFMISQSSASGPWDAIPCHFRWEKCLRKGAYC